MSRVSTYPWLGGGLHTPGVSREPAADAMFDSGKATVLDTMQHRYMDMQRRFSSVAPCCFRNYSAAASCICSWA